MPTKAKTKALAAPPNKMKELATPIKLEAISDLLIFKCGNCGNPHFRHAGYLHAQVPFMKSDRREELSTMDCPVAVCTTCKSCFIWLESKCYDVTKHIDLKAWDKVERDLHKATGPGGQC